MKRSMIESSDRTSEMAFRRRTRAGRVLLLLAGLMTAGCAGMGASRSGDWRVVEGWPRRPESIEWDVMSEAAIDSAGRIIVINRKRPHVQIYSPDGKLLQAWEKPVFKGVHGLGIAPDGHVWIVDCADHVVYKYTPDGKRVLTLGTPGEAGNDAAHFNAPTDVAVSAAGDVFVTDGYGSARVVRFNASGKYVGEWGGFGEGKTQFITPHMVQLDSKGRVYIADRDGGAIKVFDANGKSLAVWSEFTPWTLFITADDQIWVAGCSRVPNPKWKGVDPGDLGKKTPKKREGGPVVAGPPKDQILVHMNTDGKILGRWTLPMGKAGKARPGELDTVHGIAVGRDNAVYLADVGGKRVQKFVRRSDR